MVLTVEEEGKKNESVQPKIILQKQSMTMRPFLHMSASQSANHNLEMYKYHHGHSLSSLGFCFQVRAEHFAQRALQIITGFKKTERKKEQNRFLPSLSSI